MIFIQTDLAQDRDRIFNAIIFVSLCSVNYVEDNLFNQAPAELENKWGEMIRPTPRLNSSLLAAIPQNGFLGIEQREILEFLEDQLDS